MRRSLTVALLLIAGFIQIACRRHANDAADSGQSAPQTFTVQGLLRAINFAERSVTVEHESIPGYMPAMAMDFDVRSIREVEALHVGDAIEFTMLVTDDSSWIEGVRKIDARNIQLPERKAGGGSKGNVPRVQEGDLMPTFKLVDSNRRQITRESFAGKPLLLTFIFTRCPVPNFCPLVTKNFREIYQALAAAPGAPTRVQFLSISIDPEFDTPEVLAQYANSQTSDTDSWCFASGTVGETKRLTEAFSLSLQPESGTISHGLATVLVGADGAIRQIWRGNAWMPSEVMEALRAL